MTGGGGFGVSPPGGNFALAPWQMWGQTVAVEAIRNPAATLEETVNVSTQICRVNYKRPETWTFWLGGRIAGGTVSAVAASVIRVQFHISIGVGRSAFRTVQHPWAVNGTSFALFSWIVPAGVQPGDRINANNTKYTTQVQTPELEDGALEPVRHLIDHFPAEDIQIWADVGYIAGDAGTRINLELTAYVAPMNHVRPEWFQFEEQGQFRGNETGGS